MARTALPMLFVLCACVSQEALRDAKDRDSDGYLAVEVGGDDCDDSDPAVNPGQDERCGDQVDNDCDTVVDDKGLGESRWYEDRDEDSYGDGEDEGVLACTAPEGRVDNKLDCNDRNEAVHPGVTETCDGVDNDCNNSVDDNAVDGTLYYYDADGDTFGDENSGIRACASPGQAYVAIGGDCNDTPGTGGTFYPGAPELCDGLLTNCDLTELRASEVDHDGDGYVICDLTGEWKGAGNVVGGLDCDDTSAAAAVRYPGAPELCDGVANNCALGQVPSDEVDQDGDRYVECTIASVNGWYGSTEVVDGGDCLEEGTVAGVPAADVSPGEPEVCGDSVDNDCLGPDRSCRFVGDYAPDDAWASLVGPWPNYSVWGGGIEMPQFYETDGAVTFWTFGVGGTFAPDVPVEDRGIFLVSAPIAPGPFYFPEEPRVAPPAGQVFGPPQLGDLNHDGTPEIAFNVLPPGELVGDLVVVFGLDEEIGGTVDDAVAIVERHGGHVSFRDVSGDGVDDLLVGYGKYVPGGPGFLGGNIAYDPLPTYTSEPQWSNQVGYADWDGNGTKQYLHARPKPGCASPCYEQILFFSDEVYQGSRPPGEPYVVLPTGGLPSAAFPADLNGDQYLDMVVFNNWYETWVFFGPHQWSDPNDPADIHGRFPGMGGQVHDVDGDGLDDLLLVKMVEFGNPSNKLLIFYGPFSPGTFGEADADAVFAHPAGVHEVVWRDQDGDGFEDILLQSLYAEEEAGAFYIYRGGH